MSLLVLALTSTSFAQKKKVEKANEEFDKYAYIDARKIYLKVVEEGYSSPQVYKNLADTYYFNGDYDEAATWYRKLIAAYPGDTEADYYYRAAQSYKSVGLYDEADEMMRTYAALGTGKLVVKNFLEDPEYLKNIAFGARGYELEEVSINMDSVSDFGPSFYGDKLVYSTARTVTEGGKIHEWNEQPFLDLFVADMDATGVLSNPEPLSGDVNTPFHESNAAFSKDGRTMYFTRNNFTDGKKGKDKNKTIRLKLYKATKSGENFWTNVEELSFNSDNYSVAHPTLSLDGTKLYFASDMPGTLGMSDLWYVDLKADGTYGEPMNLGPSINTEARESFPFISEENNLYFSSDGRSGLGGLDVFVTGLNEQGKHQGKIVNLGEPANSSQDDFGFVIRESKRLGYVSSNRSGTSGSVNDEIYRVQEQCIVEITGIVFDKDTKDLLPGSTVYLLDENNSPLDEMIVGEDARYRFKSQACETTYTVRATKDRYFPNEIQVVTPDKTATITVDIPLTIDDPCPPEDLGCRLKLKPIYFDFDRHNIRPDAEVELAKILSAMKEYPQLIIHIESHTDSRAPKAYNETLSEKRAQSTLNWLVSNGIDRSRLTAKGYGENQLVNNCSDGVNCTEEEHQLNRRSMFIIKN